MYHETECGCGQHGHGEQHGMGHHGYQGGECDCGCGVHYGSCCAPGFGQRHFISKEEIITRMEGYLTQLRAEAVGVEERIAEFKKTDRKQH